MARIAGVNVPSEKRVIIGLQYVYGIGPQIAHQICESMKIAEARRVRDLTDEDLLKLRELIEGNYKVEGDLRREISMNMKRLMDLKTYRGLRHRRKLPVRGQRTSTNARTRRGRAVAIAGKKK